MYNCIKLCFNNGSNLRVLDIVYGVFYFILKNYFETKLQENIKQFKPT